MTTDHLVDAVWPEAPPDGRDAPVPWLDDAISSRRHAPAGDTVLLAELLRESPAAALFGAFPGEHEETRRAGAGAD